MIYYNYNCQVKIYHNLYLNNDEHMGNIPASTHSEKLAVLLFPLELKARIMNYKY